MNLDRLNRLITVLENVRDTQQAFFMGSWASYVADVDPGQVAGHAEPCGTTCCALGYAALDPTLQADGLRLIHVVSYGGGGRAETEILNVAAFNIVPRSDGYFRPVFHGSSDMEVGAKFFDISFDASIYLFNPEEYSDYDVGEPVELNTVIARVLEVIALNGEAPVIEDEEEEG